MSTRTTHGPYVGLSLAAILVAGLVSADCDSSSANRPTPAAADTVRIVTSFPAKGVMWPQARLDREAIDLALEEHGSRAGNWRVEHVALDGGDPESGDWSPTAEKANVEAAIADPSVVAYIGPLNTGATGVSLPLTNRAGLLQLSLSATWPGLTLPGWNSGEPELYRASGRRNFARLSSPDSYQAAAASRWAHEDRVRGLIILQDGSSYSNGIAAAFVHAARNFEVVGNPVTFAPADPASIAAVLRNPQVDALFYAPSSVENAAGLAAALGAASAIELVYVTDTALDDQFIERAGRDLPNWRFLFNGGTVPTGRPQWEQFSAAFERKYRVKPGVPAGNAYDLTNLVLGAVARSGRDRASIVAAALDGPVVQGAAGPIVFDENGDNRFWRIGGYRLRGGRFEFDREFTSEP